MSPFFWMMLSIFVIVFILFQLISEGWQERVGTFFFALIPVAFIGAAVWQFSPTTDYQMASSFNIVALGDSNAGSGRYFLGAGSNGKYQTYAFMYRTQDGGYKMGSRQATYSTLYEDAEPNTARIEKWVGTNGFLGGRTSDVATYRIHIPAGSVVQGYNVDVTN